MLDTQTNSLKTRLNAANPNAVADMLRAVAIGSVLLALPTTIRRFSPDGAAANSSQLSTLDTIALPDDAKASIIHRAYARTTAAAGTLGELTVEPYGTTPADGQIAVAPNGDLVLLAASRYSDVDVVYLPEKVDAIEITLPVASNVATLPAIATTPGVVLLNAATATVGTSLGAKVILVPGAGSPSAGQARLNVAKTTVTFAGADAVTMCTIKLSLGAAIDLKALLEATTALG